MNWDEFLDKVAQTIEEERLLQRGERVAVAVSGGVDSVSLFSALCQLEDRLERLWTVEAAIYIDHQLRPSETPAERRLIRELAEKYGKKFICRAIDFRAKEGSLQWGAREVRLQTLVELSRELNCQKIALAHHADDRVETLLFRILRGTSPDGLASIRPASPPNLIRPLIRLFKDEIISAASSAGLRWLEDSSNASDKYARNRIRHHLLPLLGEFNPNYRERLLQLSRLAQMDSEFFRQKLDQIWDSPAVREFLPLSLIIDLEAFRSYPPSLQWRIVRRAANRIAGGDIVQGHIEKVLNIINPNSQGEREISPRKELRVISSYRKLIFIEPSEFDRALSPFGGGGKSRWSQLITGPGEYQFWAGRLSIRCKESAPSKVEIGERPFRIYWPEAAGEPFPLVLKNRWGGERLKFGPSDRSLKRWFINAKVPKFLRGAIPLLERDGSVLWLPGLYWSDPLTEEAQGASFQIEFYPKREWLFFAEELIFCERKRCFRDEPLE